MSITRALSNAVSGLTATARGTETVAANLANVMTPGYARREVAISAQTLGGNAGGVRIDGITRIVSESLVAEARSASASQTEASTIQTFWNAMEDVVGVTGDAGSLETALSELRSALSAASTRPDDEIRLATTVNAAVQLASQLNGVSDAIQDSRAAADAAIEQDVATLSNSLERVAFLNKRIAVLDAEGKDASSLLDERQAVIDEIASIVPVYEVKRDAGAIALFTTEGAVLLDGTTPSEISFSAIGQVTPEMSVDGPALGRLVVNGSELTAAQMRLFQGGSLGASFAIRDEHAPEMQSQIDSLALELHDLFASSATDPTLAAGTPGIFTDDGSSADPVAMVGLAGRIAVNDLIRPEAGGDLSRLRDGLGASVAGPVGASEQLDRFVAALSQVNLAPAASSYSGNATVTQRFATFVANLSTSRVTADSDAAVRSARAEAISDRLMTDGVDSDAEMQRLLQYEQAYAANARVIQAIEDMMDQILRW